MLLFGYVALSPCSTEALRFLMHNFESSRKLLRPAPINNENTLIACYCRSCDSLVSGKMGTQKESGFYWWTCQAFIIRKQKKNQTHNPKTHKKHNPGVFLLSRSPLRKEDLAKYRLSSGKWWRYKLCEAGAELVQPGRWGWEVSAWCRTRTKVSWGGRESCLWFRKTEEVRDDNGMI